MKKNTRRQILDTAKRLFNEHGYNDVSLKDIADEVGISKGNLTYHFSKKENIMESLLLDGPNSKPHLTASTLNELDFIIKDMQQAVQKNTYYFLYHAQLSDLSPKIAAVQNQVYQDILNTFRQTFKNLNDQGLLRDEAFDHEYDRMIDMLHMAIIYWAPFTNLRNNTAISPDYRTHAWSIIHHLLTEKGKNELKTIISL